MRVLVTLAAAMLLTTLAGAQSAFIKAATDAFVITRMAEKFHLQPKPLDDAFSSSTFDRLLQKIDAEKIFFTLEDIQQLVPYRLKIDDELLSRQTNYLQLLSGIYEKRLKQTDTLLDQLSRSVFEFNTVEKFTVAEQTNYAANTTALKIKLRKLLKAGVLDIILGRVKNEKVSDPVKQKKIIDSLESIYRKKILSTYRRYIKKELESPGGTQQTVGEEYCEVIATYYDPHTNYFSLTTKENFDSELGQKSMLFGFSLDEDESGDVVIRRLKPGSPAYQCGQLNEGDKIISVQWEGKSSIDVSDASLQEVSSILSASNHDKAAITVQKADGIKRAVELVKVQMEDDADAGKVKSFLLKGAKTIGYISLPAFYSDWENEENNVNGCANDVAREIIKLKKENVDGLVLDLRYNGGGSVREAVELAGIFIDAGPVAMEKDRGSKVFTLKDANRGTIYDGPLFIMVNGFSASASELVAGTLQDYNRALIIGSTTYGKATSQAVLPMDTTITLEKDFSKAGTGSYIKLTMDKLYRVTGSTAQFSGVQPDIMLPDIIDAVQQREANEAFAIPPTGIEPNKFFKPLPQLNKTILQSYATNITDTSTFFKTLSRYITARKASEVKTDISLSWKEALQQRQVSGEEDAPSFTLNTGRAFTISNNQFEQQRLQGNKNLQELNDAWRTFLEKDPYLQITYGLTIQFINNSKQ
jgi:carboxyl-terminal processing protease